MINMLMYINYKSDTIYVLLLLNIDYIVAYMYIFCRLITTVFCLLGKQSHGYIYILLILKEGRNVEHCIYFN